MATAAGRTPSPTGSGPPTLATHAARRLPLDQPAMQTYRAVRPRLADFEAMVEQDREEAYVR